MMNNYGDRLFGRSDDVRTFVSRALGDESSEAVFAVGVELIVPRNVVATPRIIDDFKCGDQYEAKRR